MYNKKICKIYTLFMYILCVTVGVCLIVRYMYGVCMPPWVWGLCAWHSHVCVCMILHDVMAYNRKCWWRHANVKSLAWQGTGQENPVRWGSCQLLSLFQSVWSRYGARWWPRFRFPDKHLDVWLQVTMLENTTWFIHGTKYLNVPMNKRKIP